MKYWKQRRQNEEDKNKNINDEWMMSEAVKVKRRKSSTYENGAVKKKCQLQGNLRS